MWIKTAVFHASKPAALFIIRTILSFCYEEAKVAVFRSDESASAYMAWTLFYVLLLMFDIFSAKFAAVRSHQAETINVERLIQGRNYVTSN